VCELLHHEACIIHSSPINGGAILFTSKVVVILLSVGRETAGGSRRIGFYLGVRCAGHLSDELRTNPRRDIAQVS